MSAGGQNCTPGRGVSTFFKHGVLQMILRNAICLGQAGYCTGRQGLGVEPLNRVGGARKASA